MRSAPTRRAAVLKQFARFARGPMIVIFLFSVVIDFLFLTLPFYTLNVYSRVVLSQNVATLAILAFAAMIAFVVWGALTFYRSRLLNGLGGVFDEIVSPAVFSASLESDAKTDAAVQARLLRDVDAVRAAVGGPALQTLFELPAVPLYLATLFLVDPAVGFVTVLGCGVLVMVAYLQDRITRGEVKQGNESAFKTNAFTEATVRNSEAVHGMGMMPDLRRIWARGREEGLDAAGDAQRWQSLFMAITQAVRMILQVLVVAVTAWLIIHKEIQPAMLFINSMLVGRTLQPVQRLVSTYHTLVSASDSYGRLNAALLVHQRQNAATQLPRPRGALEVDTVSFAVRGAKEFALRAVGFKLEAGEILGVMGASGSGKSTLMRLLVGLWEPSSGQVRLDGVNILAWDRVNLGRYIGYLPQDTELFAGTIRQNIARFREDVTDEMVVAAAELAGAHKMIAALPDGYDTMLLDNGRNLSSGQRQTLGLARAVLGDPALVVLDEPNASLDAQGEHALVRALQSMKAMGVTVVVVSHRASLFRAVDRVLVLRQGVIQALGPSKEILARLIEPAADAGGGEGEPLPPPEVPGEVANVGDAESAESA